MAKDCLKKCLGRLDPFGYLSVYPHSVAPCHNLHADFENIIGSEDVVDESSNFFREFQYNATFPQPFFPPTQISQSEMNGSDPCSNLVNEKRNWKVQKEFLLKACKKISSEVEQTDFSKKRKVFVPRTFALLANHLENDPDPHYDGDYNWYYTGSNIEILEIGVSKFIILPDKSKDGDLLLSVVKSDNIWNEDEHEFISLSTGTLQPIYQICTNGGNFLVRQKNVCVYFNMVEGDNIEYNTERTMESRYPFVGAALQLSETGKFCTLSAGREICFWDISVESPVQKEILERKGKFLSDHWGNIHYITPNTILACDRDTVNLLDSRISLHKPEDSWNILGLSDVCEEICVMAPGNQDVQYIVTNHQMIGLDIRKGFKQKWTHCLLNRPSLIKVLNSNDMTDTVIIGSQGNNNVVVIENSWDEDFAVSRIPPYIMPNLRETLHAARCRGTCLSNILNSRFTASVTGLSCIKNENLINIFFCTSLGDVFLQKLIKKNANDPVSPMDCDRLSDWEKKCKELFHSTKKICHFTKIKNCCSKMKDIADGSEEIDGCEYLYDPMEKQKWHISKNNLLKFCDHLAPKLLEAWNIDDEEEWIHHNQDFVQEQELSDDEDDFFQKVKNWMENYSAFSESEEPVGQNKMETEEEQNVFQATQKPDSQGEENVSVFSLYEELFESSAESEKVN